MENQDKQPSEKPTNRHQIAFRPPRDSQPVASKSPLTKKEEKEEEKELQQLIHALFTNAWMDWI